ncbi:3-phosphoinositide-dependent protein kinase 1-like isoform X2 [Pollicipes pollicipes]|uniref:3-phosphoinositide-dependent protein kinase 1-like isoform X2 n=1 Tax=Pollicipes pollicipes TaxID=41117 RepID=UPI001884D49E|nr:3-phosphoinositide-dependent protein kinase 1-like isoform X2 [Pollicipes pollicipes]
MEFIRRWSVGSSRKRSSRSGGDPMSGATDSRVPATGDAEPTSASTPAVTPAVTPAPAGGTPARPATRRSPQDYRFGKEIGCGSFSTVYIGKDIHIDREVAIKVCEKRHIIKERKAEYVKRERDILNHLSQHARRDCPFFVRLFCTFQDSERLYFVLTLAKRGEMLEHLTKVGTFDLAVSRFYAAELVHAVEHLHRVGVIHRDLKPENVLLDEQMHIKISDFGSAKMVTREEGRQLMQGRLGLADAADDSDATNVANAANAANTAGDDGPAADPERPARARTNSFVGTPEYVSPELLQEKTTSHASDLWALGCILYQMVAGLPPFRSRSQYLIFKKILALDYVIPDDGFPEEVADLVRRLLVLEPAKRLGADDSGDGYPSIKAHRFFAGVEFSSLHEQTPPEIYPFLPGNQEHPELRSTYRVPDDLEPGLSDRQLTKVLLNMSLEECQPLQQSPAPAVRTKRNIADVPPDEAARRLAEQERDNKWHRFTEGHLILKQGLIDKRKGLFARRRMFLLTEGPHLFYVDPVHMVLKGQIPWSRHLRPEVKNFKHFFVHTPGRTYYLEDTDGYALEWVKAIEEVRLHAYGD